MNFLTLTQFTEMWKLQDALNTATSGPDWKEKGQDWNLAIKSEIMEFFDYIGWKWWKEPDKTKSSTDMQARLELVDIWHFFLSGLIELEASNESFGPNTVYNWLNTEQMPTGGTVKQLVDLDSNTLSIEEASWIFSSVILACEWSWEELYKAYIGKVALNNFRQANGYKEGTYQKIWSGEYWADGVLYPAEEDNYFLEKILQELSLTEGALTYEAVYHKLSIEYLVAQN